MQQTDFSQLPKEVQESIKNQMLLNRMNSYGAKIVQTEGFKGVENPFMHYKGMRIVQEFIELERGCETWVKDEKYPLRMCVNPARGDEVTKFKKLIPTVLKSFQGGIVKKIIALLYIRFNWRNYLDFTYWGMRGAYYADTKFYSQPVREIYRVLSRLKPDEEIISIVCAILEFDSAYRYRFQDLFAEVSKENLQKSPTQELKRVSSILFERELSSSNALGKFKKLTPLVLFYLKYFNKNLLKYVVEIIMEINADEVISSREDIYWQNAVNEKGDYNYRGKNSEERYQDYLVEKEGIDKSA